jgi:hypothetical protein
MPKNNNSIFLKPVQYFNDFCEDESQTLAIVIHQMGALGMPMSMGRSKKKLAPILVAHSYL